MLAISDVMIEEREGDGCADWSAWFGRCAPVELEIGCGKGTFLLRQARANPDRNYFGIEWANKFYRFAADRMARWGVSNVRLLRTDAREFVLRRVPPASLAAMHIYHPDPWPKKRHHKRRLVNAAFVDAAIRAIQPGGRLMIQTDHAGYFEQIESVTRDRTDLRPVPFAENGVETPATNYEVKYEREGRAIYRVAFVRA